MKSLSKSHYTQWIIILVTMILIGFIILFILVEPSLQAKEQVIASSSTPAATASRISPTLTPIPPTATAAPEIPTPTEIPPTATIVIIPESFYIMDITGTGQYFALGCEASAAVDWANYFGVFIYEYNFQTALPISDNPDLGFVGLVTGPWGQVPPYAYGVHADPVAALLREYGLAAISGKGFTLDQVREKLAQSKPIIAWVIGNMVGGIPAEYVDKQGNVTTVAAYEHVVILTGYDQDSIRYMNNGRFYEVPNEVFLNSWGVLGNMAVMAE
jgi:uncharacterized protein YvpB